jgi:tight adherence protein C
VEYLAVTLFALAIGLMVALGVWVLPAKSADVTRRLIELQDSIPDRDSVKERRRRREQTDRMLAILERVGMLLARVDRDGGREKMVHAGYRGSNALAIYWGVRLTLAAALGVGGFLVGPLLSGSVVKGMLIALWFAALGWLAPAFYVGRRVKARQKEIQLALPDALDLLVVCVEAGLALNQALVRVAEEIKQVSKLTSEQLSLVNLEIRAGSPRAEALRSLGERTGVGDVKSLVAMLIQTDRFGTSVAQSLRVHADTLRIKRRQRAEEAAAKTTIKLVFPLVLFVFPALFAVILGPALITIYRTLTHFNR